MLKIVIQDDEGKTTVVPLLRDEITVGRKEGNTIRLTERNVSRQHARIVRQSGSIAVEDLNSYNGVRVNGSRIQGRVGINVSDRIQIGDYLIELRAEMGAVPGEAYGDETQPVETLKMGQQPPVPASPSMVSIPSIPMMGASENDATTKMPAPATAMLPAASLAPGALPTTADVMTAPPVMPETGSPARLVVLSTNLAGQEYDLIRPAMVIGRTDGDNDIVVNHRSISRHHAKIVNEGGRFAIVDLQSSNGVRVNGEEYSKVELRRGDMIDLGHVRLRFVAAGEDDVFGRDAHAIAMPGQRGGKGIIYAVAGVVLIGAVAAFALTRGGGDKTAPDAPATVPKTTEVGVPKTTPPIDDKGAASKATQEDLEKVNLLLEIARKGIEKEQWSSAGDAAGKALEIQPESNEARDIVSKARLETDNQTRYETFKRAVAAKDYPGIAQAFQTIDSDSIYKDKAREDHDKSRDAYVRRVAVQAKELARKRKCDELVTLADQAAGTWDEARQAIDDVECQAAVARVNPRTTDDKKPDDGKKPDDKKPDDKKPDDKKPDDKTTEVKTTKSYDALMAEAKDAMLKSQYGKALKLCDDALSVKPRDAGAATVCGLAACNMKKSDLAKKYQKMLPAERQTMIRQTCLKAGLTDF